MAPTKRKRGETPGDRIRIALDLFDVAYRMKRQSLRRAHPRASNATIERLLLGWMRERPGAELGDGDGIPGRWPRGRTS